MRFEPINTPALRVGACGVYRKEDIYPYLDGLRYINKQGEAVYAYREDDKYIYVARGLVRAWQKDDRAEGVPVEFNSKFEPRDERQEQLIRECLAYDAKYGGYFFTASTGLGKSGIALHLASLHNRKILVTVNKTDLMVQWRNEVRKFLGIRYCDIGEIRQNKYDVAGKKVVIALAQSLAKMEDGRYPASIKTDFGVWITDESHHTPADTFQIPFYNIKAKYRIGITAELVRGDDRTDVALAHIGPVVSSVDIDNMPAKVAVIHTGLDYSYYHGTSPVRMNGLFGEYAKSNFRNSLIARLTKKAYDEDRNIILLSALKEKHLNPIRKLLLKAGVPAKDIKYYTGGLSKEKIKDAKENGRIILATYKMAEEATDIPRLDTCFLLTPKARPKQAIGRILRVFADKKEPLVVDFIDNGNPYATGFYKARLKYYRSKEWVVRHFTWNKQKIKITEIT